MSVPHCGPSGPSVSIIGAGLAGCEAALVCARMGMRVHLYEMRPGKMTPAHTGGDPGELVCSNSLKSDKLPSSHGLLKHELTILGSPLLSIAQTCRVPAGSALAVDRLKFAEQVRRALDRAGVNLIRKELSAPPRDTDITIISTGPLTSETMSAWLSERCGAETLHFYDAVAPIISGDSVDLSKAFFASRRDETTADYLNCPFTEESYRAFFAALKEADTTVAHSFENSKFFEACLPVEVLASRGEKALLFGPLRPVGLTDPKTGRWPYAVCQLRREKTGNESFNMVGFQTRLRIPEQQKVFRMIPGLEQAEFLRYGSIHRNTYLDSPLLVNGDLSLKTDPRIFLAGQLCGNEGYTESIATGHLVGLSVWATATDHAITMPPPNTALGALMRYVTSSEDRPFTPSGVHFGLFPSLEWSGRRKPGKREKKEMYCKRALDEIKAWAGAELPKPVISFGNAD